MKKIFMTLLLGSTVLMSGVDQIQKYGIKSGKIVYSSNGIGTLMGIVKIETTGEKKVIFDNYGLSNLVEKKEFTKETANGATNARKLHTMAYQNSDVVYSVNFMRKIITKMKGPAAIRSGLLESGMYIDQSVDTMMQSFGAKKIGVDKVLNFECTLWQLKGSKKCLYQGIPLRVETDINGIKHTEIAIKIEFDKDIDKKEFLLPDFPFYDQKGKKLSIDRTKIINTDKSNEKIEKKIVSKVKNTQLYNMKQDALKTDKSMSFARKCFKNADTLDDANICNKKVIEIDGKDQDDFQSWSKEDKSNLLGYIEKYLNKITPCIREAKTVREIGKCNQI